VTAIVFRLPIIPQTPLMIIDIGSQNRSVSLVTKVSLMPNFPINRDVYVYVRQKLSLALSSGNSFLFDGHDAGGVELAPLKV